MALPKFTLLALLAIVLLVQTVPASPRQSLHTQLFQEIIPITVLAGPLTLAFNMTGHDPGSDSLELTAHVTCNNTTYPCVIVAFNSTEYNAWVAAGSPGLPNLQFNSARFVVSCPPSGNYATFCYSHYSPLTEQKIILINTFGGAQTIQGRHTWTVTIIS